MDIKIILAHAVLMAGKQIISDLLKSKADNFAVRPIAGGELVAADGQKVVEALRKEFPGKSFLWLSKPVKAEAQKEKK